MPETAEITRLENAALLELLKQYRSEHRTKHCFIADREDHRCHICQEYDEGL